MNRPTNKKLIQDYLDFYRHSKQSVKMRCSSLRFFFGKYFTIGNGKEDKNWFNYNDHVFDITTKILKEYFNRLKNLNSVSITTRRNKWVILKSFLDFTMEDYNDFVIKVPSKRIKWTGAKNKETEVNGNKKVFATNEELEKILNYFKTSNFKHYVIFRMFVETGIRKGELINAKVSELNIKERYINPHEGKTDEKYYIFSEAFIKYLKLYLTERKKINTSIDVLFLNKHFNKYSTRNFNMLLKVARDKLGIPKNRNITCHTFRRTINDLRKDMGCSLEDRKRLLGHKLRDVNVKSYTSSDFRTLRAIYDKWDPYKDINL